MIYVFFLIFVMLFNTTVFGSEKILCNPSDGVNLPLGCVKKQRHQGEYIIDMNTKKCVSCMAYKSLEEFHFSKKEEDGRHYYCKKCVSYKYFLKRKHKHIPIKDLQGEIWRDIKGYEGLYKVSNLGRVKSLYRFIRMGESYRVTHEKIIKGSTSKDGYRKVILAKLGVQKHHNVHRLVAIAFIENPQNFPVVNHLDCNPSNNNAYNLEWTTTKGNIQHAAKNNRMAKGARHHMSKPVAQFSLNGKFIASFESINLAAKSVGCFSSGIRANCAGRYQSCHGYVWKYV